MESDKTPPTGGLNRTPESESIGSRLSAVVPPTILVLAGIVSGLLAVLRWASTDWSNPGLAIFEAATLLAVSAAAITAAGVILNHRYRSSTVAAHLDGWEAMEQRAYDLREVRKEQDRTRRAVERLTASLNAETKTLSEAQQSLHAELQKIDAALVESRQVRAEAKAMTTRWDSLAMDTVDALYRIVDKAGVRGPYEDLKAGLQGLGLDIVEPPPSTEVHERQHEVSSTEPSTDVAPGAIVRTAVPGFRRGERVLRPAKVVQAFESPTTPSEPDREPSRDLAIPPEQSAQVEDGLDGGVRSEEPATHTHSEPQHGDAE